MKLDLPAVHWSSLGFLVIAFTLGASVAAIVAFRRWRRGKKVVPREFWTRMVDGYVALERSYRHLNSAQSDSQIAHRATSDRLELRVQENRALHERLLSLEEHVENVTSEATSLVTGLKDNEQRWAEAEMVRTDLETELDQTRNQISINAEQAGSLTTANEELTHHLLTTAAELSSANPRIERLQADLDRRSNLEARLNEALDRDRQQMATLVRLEGRYKKTHRQFVDANRRAAHLEQQLRAGTPVEPRGVFDRAVPTSQPVTLDAYDHEIDLRSRPEPTPPRSHRHRAPRVNRLARSHGRLPQ